MIEKSAYCCQARIISLVQGKAKFVPSGEEEGMQ
jgi:hypothetical protein